MLRGEFHGDTEIIAKYQMAIKEIGFSDSDNASRSSH